MFYRFTSIRESQYPYYFTLFQNKANRELPQSYEKNCSFFLCPKTPKNSPSFYFASYSIKELKNGQRIWILFLTASSSAYPPPHTSPSSAIDKIKALPSQKSYTQKVDEHIKIINSASPSDLQALKTYYQDKPYLRQEVYTSLNAQHSDKIEALFDSRPPVFTGELYRDLLKHQDSANNRRINQLLDQKRDVAAAIGEAERAQSPASVAPSSAPISSASAAPANNIKPYGWCSSGQHRPVWRICCWWS